MFGLLILTLSLVFTGFLGILQDLAYRNYGQHWKEALFYAVRIAFHHIRFFFFYASGVVGCVLRVWVWRRENRTLLSKRGMVGYNDMEVSM